MTVRVVHGDDYPAFRLLAERVLDGDGIDVVASVPTLDALVDAAARHAPDVVVMDRFAGAPSVARVRAAAPDAAVVVLSGYPAAAAEADLRRQVDAYVGKDAPIDTWRRVVLEAAGADTGDAEGLHDPGRLDALVALAILDTAPEAEFDDLAFLAAAIVGDAIGAVNFVDAERHFTKAVAGAPLAGSSVRNQDSLCATTIQEPGGSLVVPDVPADPRLAEHPAREAVGFYAGVAIESRGRRVGVLCTFGPQPRVLSDDAQRALAGLARQAERLLEARRQAFDLAASR